MRNAQVPALLNAPLGIQMVVRSLEEARREGYRVLSAERLSELAVRCGLELSPYFPDYQERVRALLARAPSLQREAEQLLAIPGTADWFADLDRGRQAWISPDGRPPLGPSGFHPDLRPFGSDVAKPLATLWTSTSAGRCPSSWISYLRYGGEQRPPPYHPWRLAVDAAAQVYEIHGPEAWQALCLDYPKCTLDGAVIPDWEAVAKRWDGVHLSMGGLLTAQGVSRGGPGARTQLAGWDVESTVWLRWVFEGVERLPDVE
ncbi:MAG: hypothetical protein JWO42_3349 [Chloroflexi bacterium]|nr:hypothetical protein [Chloroflexota bacterium]